MPFSIRPYRRFPVLADHAHRSLSNLQLRVVRVDQVLSRKVECSDSL